MHRGRSRNGNQSFQWTADQTNDARTVGEANSVQAAGQRDGMHLTVNCSQSWTWEIFHINGEPAGRVLGAIHIDVEIDSTAAIGMESRTSAE